MQRTEKSREQIQKVTSVNELALVKALLTDSFMFVVNSIQSSSAVGSFMVG